MFEDIKGVTGSRTSNKDRKHKWPKEEGLTTIYKTLHNKPKIDWHEPFKKKYTPTKTWNKYLEATQDTARLVMCFVVKRETSDSLGTLYFPSIKYVPSVIKSIFCGCGCFLQGTQIRRYGDMQYI